MDANQTRFHLVLGRGDWLPQPADGLDWDTATSSLTLARRLFLFPPRQGESPPDFSQRRGAARDRYGNWYWISDDRSEIRFLSPAGNQSEHFWSAADAVRAACIPSGASFTACVPPPPRAPLVCSALAVTTGHYLVAGLLDPSGLLIFDLHAGGSPAHMLWPADVPFRPFDMAPTPDGGVWILDRENRRYWQLDRRFELVPPAPITAPPPQPETFQPVGGPALTTACSLPSPPSDRLAMPAPAADPVAIEALPDGRVLLLDRNPGFDYSVVYRCRFGESVAASVTLDRALAGYLDPRETSPEAVSGYDLAYIDRPSPTVYIVERAGNQSFAFTYTDKGDAFTLALVPSYFPMRLFGGKALVAAGGTPYYDFDDRWIALAEQPRPRYASLSTVLLPAAAFDGQEPGCVWHRFFVDGCIPPGASLTVESRAADEVDFLTATPWQLEPAPYLRGTGLEIAWCAPDVTGEPDRSGVWELLFQNAIGRYLQIRLTLSGTGRNTPRLHAVRVYYPRFSYLKQYLPAVYREDATSASFLDRYLANTEGQFTDIEGRIANVQSLFDTRTIPAEYLDWLANWFGATLDAGWEERRRRLFLSHAPQFFRERGTVAGLIRAIRLWLDPCVDDTLFTAPVDDQFAPTPQSFSVRIVERYLTRTAPGVDFGDASDLAAPGVQLSALNWTPAQGSGQLHQRYRTYLALVYTTIDALNAAWNTSYDNFNQILLPAMQPSGTQGADWQRFLAGPLGFTYNPVTAADAPQYRQFLAQRYPNIADLNRAYGLTGTAALASFAEVQSKLWDSRLTTFPSAGLFLQDWIVFVSVVLPAVRNAHRFTVLVPVAIADSPDTQINRREVARRVTEMEKPAHTSFDVKLYYALFRVGGARVGIDSVLGDSSRFVALVLGGTTLSGAYLEFTEPWNVSGRGVVGRDTAGRLPAVN